MPSARSSAEPGDAYAACLDAAVELAAPLAHRLALHAGESLVKRAASPINEADRKRQLEAAQYLNRNRNAIAEAFPNALRREFESTAQVESSEVEALGFDSLELMAEDQLDETVELVRAQQFVLSAVEAELVQFNTLISAARGFEFVRASANALRPEAWVRAMRNALLQCTVPVDVRHHWLTHLSEALGPELAAIYRQLSGLLRTRGVAAASFEVNAAPAREAGRKAPKRSRPQFRPRQEASARRPLLNLRDLRALLVGHAGPSRWQLEAQPAANAGPETANPGVTVPWALDALKEMKQVDEVVQRMRQRLLTDRGSSQPVPPADSPLSPVTPAQALSQEVVKLMVENVAADQRLVPEVQQAVRDLEPALLKLARNDPRFFNDKQHPARRLLAEMTERSLAWRSADVPGFTAFFEPLRQAVEALSALSVAEAEPFEFALQSLGQAWHEQEQSNHRQQADAARALLKAEERNLMAAQIATDLSGRPDVAAAPGEIRRFIGGAWVQVMAAARVADTSGGTDPGGYAGVVNDLIWSSQPALAGKDLNRLEKLVPQMTAVLRQGLASIGYPQELTRRFMDFLADLHRKARPPASPTPVEQDPQSRDELAVGSDENAMRPEVWLDPSEARDSSPFDFQQTQPNWEVTLPSQGVGALAAGSAHTSFTARLHPGIWVDLCNEGTWSRYRLNWMSPHSLLYMFSDNSGKVHSMTRSTLDRLIASDAVRIVSEQSVLEGALDAVAQAALRNSVDGAA